jgi:pilus assembly protein Flp/PilA
MNYFAQKICNFVREEEGATAIEYGLLAALVAVMIIGGATTIGESLKSTFEEVATKLGGGKK